MEFLSMLRHTVLVLDDEPNVGHSVRDLLRTEYHVLTCTRPCEALELIEKGNVHVIMTDQRMPEMSGVEFLNRIRPSFPEPVRLLFTAYSDLRSAIDAINRGQVYRYIAKPWDPEELRAI